MGLQYDRSASGYCVATTVLDLLDLFAKDLPTSI